MKPIQTAIVPRKHLMIVISILMTLLLSTIPAFGLSADTPSSWAFQEVNQARNAGLVIPAADLHYQSNIDRELFCELVINMVEVINGYEVKTEIPNPFVDTTNPEVLKAYQLGIVAGKTVTHFAPEDEITREQLAAMMMRAARVLDLFHTTTYAVAPEEALSQLLFADQNSISGYALLDVRLANYLEIVFGVGENRINPLGQATVEQSILMINRLFHGFTEFHQESNQAPVALAEPVEFTVAERIPLILNASQLASDPDGDSLTVFSLDTNSANGTFAILDDGTCRYISNEIDADETVIFYAFIYDGKDTTRVTLNVKVIAEKAENTAPIAVANPVVFSVNELVTLSIPATQLATDPEGEPLKIIAVSPTNYGTATVSSDQSTLLYTSFNLTGDREETLAITLTDGTATTTVQTTINIASVEAIIALPTIRSVAISGDKAVGSVVQVEQIAYNGGTPLTTMKVYYTWFISDTPTGTAQVVKSGADANTYTIQSGDMGKYIKLYIFAMWTEGGSALSNVLGPVEVGRIVPDNR